MKDIQDLEDIKIFVNEFYNKVQEDELLAPIFASKINAQGWEVHLNRMYDFWNTILFFKQSYKGNPFSKHSNLAVHSAHFTQWVDLFSASIDKYFAGDKAEETKRRAANMAQMFQNKLEHFSNNPEQKPIM